MLHNLYFKKFTSNFLSDLAIETNWQTRKLHQNDTCLYIFICRHRYNKQDIEQ